MTQADKARLLTTLEKAPGPSPWYWKTFPRPTGASGQRFAWSYHGNAGPLAYLVTLALEQQPDKPRVALNSYCTPFSIPPHGLGIWCPESRAVQAGNPYFRVLFLDPDQLVPFSLAEVAGWFKQSNDRIYAVTPPIAEFEVSSVLPAGTHKLDFPKEFHTLDELILVGARPASGPDDAASAILLLYPNVGLVEVLPQKWFTAKQTDIGYQWITRVTRDPETHRLIGDGIRVGSFLLEENGCELAGWIEKQIPI